MKEKFECEICHAMYESKERALDCEEKHKASETPFPVKEICYNDNTDTFTVLTYPNAKYKKNDDIIRIHGGSYWRRKHSFFFEEIQNNDDNELSVYTTNFDDEHEKELINRIINYKIALLNEKIERLNGKIEVSHMKVDN